MSDNKYKTATELAKETGVSRQTIHNYEKRGLIHPSIKTETVRLRLYSSDTIDQINNIRKLKNKLKNDSKLSAIKKVLEKSKV